jgi:hypothetical protein
VNAFFSSWDPAVKAIGTIHVVRGPRGRILGAVAFWFLTATVFAPYLIAGPIVVLTTIDRTSGKQGIAPYLEAVTPYFFPIWILVVLGAIYWAFRKLCWRLLVGSNGIAIWEPTRTVCVRWDELGTVWNRSLQNRKKADDSSDGLLVLEHTDGTLFVINSYFTGHERVVRQVLRRLSAGVGSAVTWPSTPTDKCLRQSTNAIQPEEPGIVEPHP